MKYAIGAVAVLAAPCLCGVVVANGVIAVADDQHADHARAVGGLSLRLSASSGLRASG